MLTPSIFDDLDIRKVKEGKLLVEQGQLGHELFLLLDGVLSVEVDGVAVAEVGPGAVVGERAALLDGTRTATLRARTKGRVASVPFDALDPDALGSLSIVHERDG